MKYTNIAFLGFFFLVGYGLADYFDPYKTSDHPAAGDSVRICQTDKQRFYKCGTGVYINPHQVLTAWHVISPVQDKLGNDIKTSVAVLYRNSNDFEHAVIVSSYPSVDLAVIGTKETFASAVLDTVYHQGETVWVTGNPMGRNFEATKTVITGTDGYPKYDGSGIAKMIMIDSKDNRVRSGYSGGGLFSEKGLVGIVQLCNEDVQVCLAISSEEIKKVVKELK